MEESKVSSARMSRCAFVSALGKRLKWGRRLVRGVPCRRSTLMNGRIYGYLALCFAMALAVFAFSACSERPLPDGEQGKPGQLHLALTAESSTGNVYRLRRAIFTVTSASNGQTIEVSTEEDPNRSSIDLELPAGDYSVLLNGGYYLEHLSGPGAPPSIGDAGSSPSYLVGKGRLFRAAVNVTRDTAPTVPDPDAGAPLGVPSKLLSENPQFATVRSDESTSVVFVFRVLGESTGGDAGSLSIGIEVLDDGCVDDGNEPNDTPLEATPLLPDEPLTATACPDDDDFYSFASPVAAGELFAVTVAFSNDVGDIDAVLIDQYGDAVSGGFSVTDDENLQAISDGGNYTLLVYTYNTANQYTITVFAGPSPAASDCCTPTMLPSCTEPTVASCVCDLDPFCCGAVFDASCVSLAIGQCGMQCGTNQGSCCETSDEGGCGDAVIEQCVCATDPQCCYGGYDELCIAEAAGECGLSCSTQPPESDCCQPSELPGCSDPSVSECVCEFDPYCCGTSFDETCTNVAVAYCGASCEKGK